MDNDINKLIDERIAVFMKSQAFTSRKIGDTPTDDLALVPRKYVNAHGTTANRPTSSVAQIGQSYFATDTNIKMTYKGSNQWVNGVASVVA